jgi:hypothetical protein
MEMDLLATVIIVTGRKSRPLFCRLPREEEAKWKKKKRRKGRKTTK